MHISLRGVFGLRSAALPDVLEGLRHYSSASFAVPTRNGNAGVPTLGLSHRKLHRWDWNDGMRSPSTPPSIAFLKRSIRCSRLIEVA